MVPKSCDGCQVLSLLKQFCASDVSRPLTTVAKRGFDKPGKIDPDCRPNPQIVLALANLLLSSIDIVPRRLLPTSESNGVEWLTTTTQPSDDWMKEAFDDSGWQKQTGAWARESTSELVVRSAWVTSDIWLRRTFEWQPGSTEASLIL